MKNTAANLLSEAEQFIREAKQHPSQIYLANRGADLANRLSRAAVDMGYSKATEFSCDREELDLMAAKAALVAFGASSRWIEKYERALPLRVVTEYETFKAAYLGDPLSFRPGSTRRS